MKPTAIEFQNARKVLHYLHFETDVHVPGRLIQEVEKEERRGFKDETKTYKM